MKSAFQSLTTQSQNRCTFSSWDPRGLGWKPISVDGNRLACISCRFPGIQCLKSRQVMQCPGGKVQHREEILRRTQAVFLASLFWTIIGGSRALAQVPGGFTWSLSQQRREPESPSQQVTPNPQDTPQPNPAPDKNSKIDSPQPKIQPDAQTGQQTNYRSVSANTYLPPQSFKQKFWLATQDSFDYSAFIYTGLIAGGAMAGNSEPSFGQGASGYGIYFAHTFADGTIENYFVEAIVPTVTKQDPRYYTRGRGGFFKRSGYAASRLFVTRKDSGNETLNLSEIIGAGAAAGIGNAYYPSEQNRLVKTYQRWISQLVQDAAGNLAKEFWPNINRALFHGRY